MTLKRTDLAYAAGIIDGEGYIGIAQTEHKQFRIGYRTQLDVRVGSTDEALCQWLKASFGGCLYPHLNRVGNQAWDWLVSARRAAVFLKLVLPYLKLKHPQAVIAIKFQAAKRLGGGARTAKEQEREKDQSLMLRSMHSGKNGRREWRSY